MSFCARCSGVLGNGWAEVILAKQFQISEFLVEECEAVGRRGPHAKCPRSVFFKGVVTRVFDCCYAGAGGSLIVSVRLEVVIPMVEEFRLPVGFAVGCGFCGGTALVTTT